MKNTAIILIGFISCLALFLGGNQFASAADNLLINPGFEEPYTGGVAHSWSPWFYDSNEKKDCSTEIYYVQPVWSAETNFELVREGQRSQHIGNNFDTWRGGVHQPIDGLVVGRSYRFEVTMFGRISDSQWPLPSSSDGFINGRVGIDPNGGTDGTADSVIWGDSITPRDSWQTAHVEAATTGSSVTLFIEGNVGAIDNCHAHLDMWFDDASLAIVPATGLDQFNYLPVIGNQ